MSSPETEGRCGHALELLEPTVGNYFVSTYPPFSCWTKVAADDFRRVLDAPPAATQLGLYVHIPFCVDRCHYCYYLSTEDKLQEIDRYLEALLAEAEQYANRAALAGRRPSFVYFGGGTPSILSEARIARLLPALQRFFPFTDAEEVTFECAPKSVTEAKLRTLRDAGVTRISLGVQQMNDDVLRANGRVHLVADVERAFAAIRAVGFDVVNLDLMVGLVGETDASFDASLERILELGPESVTIYQLEIPLNTPLYRSIRDGTLAEEPASWAVKRTRLRRAMARLEARGYAIRSGYSAVRDAERHRFVYQDEQYRGADLLGIGTSAFSHLAGVNHQNLAAVDAYLERVANGELPLWRGYALTDEERMVRELVLQLKLGGVEVEYFRSKFGVDVRQRFAAPLAEYESAGYLSVGDDAVRVTRDGLLRVDRLLEAFYLPAHQGVRYS